MSETDPLDLITWVQYRAAFEIAVEALDRIGSQEDPGTEGAVARLALKDMQTEVRRFDETEPSWAPRER